MNKFNVGDTVRIIDTGMNFGYYRDWLDFYGINRKINPDPEYNKNGKVIHYGVHLTDSLSYGILYAIEDEEDELYLIGESSLSLVEPKKRPNGIDAFGEPIHFSHRDLQLFDRLFTGVGVGYIVTDIEQDGKVTAEVCSGFVDPLILCGSDFALQISSVYSRPIAPGKCLSSAIVGNRRWERRMTPPETNTQKQIGELKETIEKASQQIKQLEKEQNV